MDGTCHCEALVGRTGRGNVCPGADLAELFDVVTQNEINGANDKTGYPRVRNESIIFALTRSGGRVLR